VHDVQRRAPLGAGLGQREPSAGKSNVASVMRPGGFAPARATGSGRDHQVHDDEQLALEREHDALAEAPHGRDTPALHGIDRRRRGAQQERVRDDDALDRLADDARRERVAVGFEVGELGMRRLE
jgi:hypothetical protein